jgi:hypothetical protein
MLISCAAVGTKTIYKSNQIGPIRNIGFAKLDNDSILCQIFPKTNEIFNESVTNTLNKYGIYDARELVDKISFEEPDINRIIEICNDYGIDALLLSRLKFIHVTYTLYFAPIAQNFDTEVEMKLFDKNGRLLVSARHNTLKGNSYMMPPPADRTVYDGAEGAFKRIAKEIGMMKIK